MYRLTLLVFAVLVMSSSALAAGDAEKGYFVYKTYCMICHKDLTHPDAHTYQFKAGLDLRGIMDAESAIGLGVLDDARMTEWLKSPKDILPKTEMMRMPLDDQQIADVIAYMRTIPSPYDRPDSTPSKSAASKMVSAKASSPPKQIRRCYACHDLSADKLKKVGPPLFGLYGKAPSIEGVPFAKWDEKALEQWLSDPKAVKSNTSMNFKGLRKAEDRKALIDYLKTLK